MITTTRHWRRGLAVALLCLAAVPASADPRPDPPGARAIDAPIQLRAVRFVGHTRLSDDELQAIAAPFLGRPLRALDLEELRQRVTRAYVERGYVSSGAQFDDDALRDGTLTLRVVEGVIGRVRQTGLGRLSPDYLSVRLADPDEPLHLGRLQERFQLQLADPLFERLNARLLPDQVPGRSLLDIEVTRARPWQVALFAHNQGAPAVGSDIWGVDGSVRNLSGWGDRLALTLQRSGGSTGGELGWTIPVAASRTLAQLRVSRQRSSVVEEPLNDLDIASVVSSREATLSHPFVDEARQRWAAGLTHALRHNRTRLGGEPFSFVAGESTGTTRIETWRLFLEGTQRLGPAVVATRLTRGQGRNNVQPDPELPRVPAARYGLWQLQAQAQLPLADDALQLLLRAQAQRSRQALVPMEQMAIGGRQTVRGWRENSRVRDNAQAFSIELHWPLRRAEGGIGPTLTLVPFVDAGTAWNVGEAQQHLSSAGLGIQVSWSGIDAELFVGHPLNTRDPASRGNAQDHGIHFLLRWRPQP